MELVSLCVWQGGCRRVVTIGFWFYPSVGTVRDSGDRGRCGVTRICRDGVVSDKWVCAVLVSLSADF